MKFKHYLNETSINLDELKIQLSKVPKSFLQTIHETKRMFFRGYSDKLDIYDIFDMQMRRQPRDTPVELHMLWDKAFEKLYNWKARSQAIFTVTNIFNAEEYGYPYIFFPLDQNYKYLWSSLINDMTRDFRDELLQLIKYNPDLEDYEDLFSYNTNFDLAKALSEMPKEDYNEIFKETLTLFKAVYNYNKGLKEVLTKLSYNTTEIMFYSKKYLLVEPKYINQITIMISDILKG